MNLVNIKTSLKEVEQIGLECSQCGSITLVSIDKVNDFKKCGVCAKSINANEHELLTSLKYAKKITDGFNLIFVSKSE